MNDILDLLHNKWNKVVGDDYLAYRDEDDLEDGESIQNYLTIKVNPNASVKESRGGVYTADFVTGEFALWAGYNNPKLALKSCYRILSEFLDDDDYEADCEMPEAEIDYDGLTGHYTFEFTLHCRVEIGVTGQTILVGVPNKTIFDNTWRKLLNIVKSIR